MEGAVPLPVVAILSQQRPLAAEALKLTGDTNEAGLLVGRIVSRAFLKFERPASDDVIREAMWRDFDQLVGEQRAG